MAQCQTDVGILINMKEVLILRHSYRGVGDSISKEGIAECRKLAPQLGKFSLVLASPAMRTQQTAQELTGQRPGVDERALQLPLTDVQQKALTSAEAVGGSSLEILKRIWGIPGMPTALETSGTALLELAQDALASLPEGGRGLIVAHNLTMLALEKIVRKQDFATIDHNIEPLHGFVFTQEDFDNFTT